MNKPIIFCFLTVLFLPIIAFSSCSAKSDTSIDSNAEITETTQVDTNETARPSSYPSTGKAVAPTKDATPEQVLECYIDCLKKGDQDTLCTLFIDSDPAAVKKQVLYPFYGPLDIWNVHISRAEETTTVSTSEVASERIEMYLTFSGRDTLGSGKAFGLTDQSDMDIAHFPQLQKVGGVWKIYFIGGSSPASCSVS